MDGQTAPSFPFFQESTYKYVRQIYVKELEIWRRNYFYTHTFQQSMNERQVELSELAEAIDMEPVIRHVITINFYYN